MPSTATIKRTEQAKEREQAVIDRHPDVLAACAHIDEAKAELDAIERRVIDGDDTVTIADTGRAREQVRYAELQLAAARKRIRDQRDQARHNELDQAVAQARTALAQNGREHIAQLQAEATEALTRLLQALDEQQAVHRDTVATFRRLGAPQWDTDPDVRLSDVQSGAVPFATTSLSGGGYLWLDGNRYAPNDRERTAAQVVAQANRATGSGLHFARDLVRYLR